MSICMDYGNDLRGYVDVSEIEYMCVYIQHLVSYVFYKEETDSWVGACLLWWWLSVYLTVPAAHLWECRYLARGLDDPSIFNGVPKNSSWLFMPVLSTCFVTHLIFTASHNLPLADSGPFAFPLHTLTFPNSFDVWVKLSLTQRNEEGDRIEMEMRESATQMLKQEKGC